MSTFLLSQQYKGIPVLGIDRSENRLERNLKINHVHMKGDLAAPYDNVKLVRADLVDFWTLALRDSNWVVSDHYILYPNPYPKGKHLVRRWHGHPVFPVLLGLGIVYTHTHIHTHMHTHT
jgi:tRNA (guanine-N7-)-methyltransferase